MTSAALEFDPTRFLFKEARLLDDFNLDGWLRLLDQKIEYTAPVRQTVNILDGPGSAGAHSISMKTTARLRCASRNLTRSIRGQRIRERAREE